MDPHPVETAARRNLWVRGLLMILMAVAYHVSGMLLFVVAVVQFAFALIGESPNPYLLSFGRSLGSYFQQNVNFLTFVTEEMPFPFKEWPS